MADKKKILIVEDNIDLLEILHQKLLFEGYAVYVAKDGEEGLKIALTEHPDLILLDIIMPKMNGMIMLDKLRQDDWGVGASVIVLSNLSDVSNISEAAKKGASTFLIKSDWKLTDVIDMVNKKLHR